MLKFLRKYDKWILAIGGSLLMVAFLLPQALQQMGQGGRDRVVATYAHGEITSQERFAANRRLSYLRNAIPFIIQQMGIEDQDHWLMLVEEARRMGVVGGPDSGRGYIERLSRLSGIDSETLYAQLLVNSGVSEQFMLESFAELSGVTMLGSVQSQIARVSEPEILRQQYATTPTVGLHAAVISADSVLEGVSRFPVEEDLLAFFEEHKNETRGAGRLDFGYRVEDAVRFEWIDLAPELFANAIEIDPVDVNTRWRRYQEELYPGEFAEERDRVEEDMRREIITRILGDAQTVVLSAVSRAERDGTELDLPEIAETIRTTTLERTGVQLPTIAFDQRDDRWYTYTDVQATPRVRNARMQSGAQTNFPRIALNVRELNPEDPHDAGVGDIIGPLRSASGSLIYARVTQVRPAGAPESLDAVREQVVEDFRLRQAWDELLVRAERYPVQVAARGLSTVVANAGGELVAGVRATPSRVLDAVSRSVDQNVLRRVNDAAFAADLNERAAGFEPIGDIRDLPAEERIVVSPLPDEAAVAIGELISVDPITLASFRLKTLESLSTIVNDRMLRQGSPYSFERMKQRLSYERLGAQDDEEIDEALADLEAGLEAGS